MTEERLTAHYFPHIIQISSRIWHSHDLGTLSRLITERRIPRIIFYRQLALKLTKSSPETPVHASHLNLFATLQSVLRYLVDVKAEAQQPGILLNALERSGLDRNDPAFTLTAGSFVELFPPKEVLSGAEPVSAWLSAPRAAEGRKRTVLRELLLLRLAGQNPALDSFRAILDDGEIDASLESYRRIVEGTFSVLGQGPVIEGLDMTLAEALQAPMKAAPHSLAEQLGFIREHWHSWLPPELLEEVAVSFDILLEEEREREWGGGPQGPPPVLEFGPREQGFETGSSVFGGYDYPEYERFSADADWMSNVVLMAKMVYVWLDQLSRAYGYPIEHLDQIPDGELDRLAAAGFTGLWLIGVWERSPASQRIKQLCGNPEAISSAYSLYDYEIAADLGGWEALANLRQRAFARGIRLASDMVPNHTGIYSRWMLQHPDWFVQTDYPPFPTYQFNGENLSQSDDAIIQIEDGYWTKTDAAVVFRYIERHTGRTRYIYHGNDGTSIPWNDTAQLNYLLPEVREAAIQTILHVARNFPIIRFDAAMTLAKKHYQRLWFPIRGLGGGIPSRAEHGMSREEFDALFPVEFWREVVDRVAAEVPDTLLLAEAFWLMEGYFVRTLGMHRVYNSAFMNMLKMEENAKYRQTIKNVLEFNPEVLKRFVNFMNNPDERTAVEQFGAQGKYFGACILMVTMPGLPMFGHGQIEGFHEKYGMEYKRAYWDEAPDEGLVRGHELWIFPLLRRRWLFSDSANFVLYDFYAGMAVDENVFAYSNRCGNHRALILYNNRYGSTAGWIRESASFAVKGGNGEQELLRTTLSDALGFIAEPGVFYAFRDVATGQEYLRHGHELVEKGLYAELGEYQFFVLMDFCEIHDDVDQSWGNLCAALGGRGVENLEVERRQVRYASLNAAFRGILKQVSAADVSGALVAAESGEVCFAREAQRFLSLLNAQTAGCADRIPGQVQQIKHSFGFLSNLTTLTPRIKTARALLSEVLRLIDATPGVQVLIAWLVLRERPEALEEYGLDYTFRCVLDVDTSPPSPLPADALLLLKALLVLPERRVPCDETLATAFELEPCCRFMAVHESDGTSWFNKERFELFVHGLVVAYLAELAGERPPTRTVEAWLRATGQEVQRLFELASHAGYRTVLFHRMLVPPEEEVPAKKRKASPKSTVRTQNRRGT